MSGYPSARRGLQLGLTATVCLVALAATGQPVRPDVAWSRLASTPPDKIGAERWVTPLRGELFRMDATLVRGKLGKARRAEPAQAALLGNEIELPMPDGTTARFKIVDAPVMAPELAAKFPEIKTYAGQGIDDPGATVRLDLTPQGLHAQILSPKGAVYVDPAYRGDATNYVSYYKRDYRKLLSDWECQVMDRGVTGGAGAEASASDTVLAKTQSGGTLRTYRLAVAATGEYTAYHGGTIALGQAAIVTAINRVNQIFEAELAVRLVLVANNDQLVYTDGGSDPYSNDDGSAMLAQNQLEVDETIGNGNYDIGHVFSTGGGGVASFESVCSSTRKARGVTGLPAPVGDPFYVDYVCHEMGHQFGGDHTFNSVTGGCGGSARVASVAFEPGSGSTIMAYAGLCSPNNLQNNSSPYFHAGSLDQIQTFIAGAGGGCASNSATGNSAPTVNAGADYTIPASTPFVLTASASDPNGDAITYCWEELDLGPATALTDPDNGSSPLFRSFAPTNSSVRYFPQLSSVLANTNWNQEIRPTTSRTMDFRVTVRDNRSGGGGVADDDMTVTSVAGTGPFVMTAPGAGVTWSNTHSVTWNVAGTTAAPINASGVNIYLSTDGGLTFPYLLVTNTPNDGVQSVTLPVLSSTQARIKVQGAGNIFYAVSPGNFTLVPYGPLPQIASSLLVSESCSPTNGAIDPYETVTVNLTVTNVGTAPTTNLAATLLTSNGIYYPSGPQNYGVIPVGGAVTRPFSFIPTGSCGSSVTGVVSFTDGPTDLGNKTWAFGLGQTLVTVVTQAFVNASSILIPDGLASSYPSTIPVSGVTNPIGKVRVTLTGLSHTYPQDIGMILAGPGGQTVALMDSCGTNIPVSGRNLVFDDSAASGLPQTTIINSGTYRPTNFGPAGSYPLPAPEYPYGSTLAPLGVAPNGTWSLHIVDWSGGDTGSIAGGWKVELLSSSTNYVCCNTLPPVGSTSAIYSNSAVNLAWETLPGLYYQVQYRTNLTLGSWQNYGAPIPSTGVSLSTNDLVSGSPMRFYRIQVLP